METERKWNQASGSTFEGEHGTKENIKGKARNTADKARSQVRSLADSGRTELSHQLGGIGRALRSAGDQLRNEESGGKAGQYTDMLADRADRVSRYLDEHDAGELIGEVENLAKRSPLVFLGGCVAVGFVLGRFLKASPGERNEPREHMPLGVAESSDTGGRASYATGSEVGPDVGPVVTTEVGETPGYYGTPSDGESGER